MRSPDHEALRAELAGVLAELDAALDRHADHSSAAADPNVQAGWSRATPEARAAALLQAAWSRSSTDASDGDDAAIRWVLAASRNQAADDLAIGLDLTLSALKAARPEPGAERCSYCQQVRELPYSYMGHPVCGLCAGGLAEV